MTYDAIILGAGAAGLMAASVAGQRGRRVLLVDHADEVGKKILISGGGRCNFTNSATTSDRYLSANPHFARSALSRYTPADFLALIDAYGIAWHEKTLGQLFCDGSARQVVAMLLDECAKGRVDLALGQPVRGVTHADARFGGDDRRPHRHRARAGDRHRRPVDPQDGRDRLRLRPRPAIRAEDRRAPPRARPADAGRRGNAVPVAVGRFRGRRRAVRQGGVPGGGAVHAPRVVRPRDPASVVLLAARRCRSRSISCRTPRPAGSPPRSARGRAPPCAACWARICPIVSPRRWPIGSPSRASWGPPPTARSPGRKRRLASWSFTPNGSEGYAKAEVTAGGISTAELSQQTMQAKRVQNLYVVGEAVDVTGWLGGYNFQWAWASGWAAGQAL